MRRFLLGLAGYLLYTALFVVVLFASMIYKITEEDRRNEHIHSIYKRLLAQTGQIQDRLPLIIDNSKEINAYTDGFKVVIYEGMINFTKNDDEVALVLGHEIAHGMLRHTAYTEFGKSEFEVAVAEGNADKLGALYLLKAGYDICSAREIWKRMSVDQGDYQGRDHPTYIYRYNELNVNCN